MKMDGSLFILLASGKSQSNMHKNLDLIVLIMHQCPEPLFFDLIHPNLPRDHRFRFQIPYRISLFLTLEGERENISTECHV